MNTLAQPAFEYQRDFKVLLDSSRDKTCNLYYGKLVERFNNDDSSLTRREILTLLIGFTGNPHYDPLADMESEKEIFDLNDGGNYDEALKESKDYLARHPVSLRVLKERSFSYNQTGKITSCLFFLRIEKLFMVIFHPLLKRSKKFIKGSFG